MRASAEPGLPLSSEASREELLDLEGQIDSSYETYFPSPNREVGYFLLLSVFEQIAQQHSPGAFPIDALKYPLMHAFRWGHRATVPTAADYLLSSTDLRRAHICLRRASDYSAVCWGFHSLHRRKIVAAKCGPAHFRLSGRSEWNRYDTLDYLLGAAVEHRHLRANWTAFQSTPHQDSRSTPTLEWVKNVKRALRPAGEQLPDAWTIEGATAREATSVWSAIEVRVTVEIIERDQRLPGRVVIQPLGHLVAELAAETGLDGDLVKRLLRVWTYDEGDARPDVGIAPIVCDSGGNVLLAPMLVASNSWVRNSLAWMARNRASEFNKQSKAFEVRMRTEFCHRLRVLGYMCVENYHISTSLGKSDIDVLIMHPRSRQILAVELKWMIKTADYTEVMGRAETRLKESVEKQLPKYREFLLSTGEPTLNGLFGPIQNQDITFRGVALVCRGNVGTPGVSTPDFPLIPEELFFAGREKGWSLERLHNNFSGLHHLPKVGRDLRLTTNKIETPNGLLLEIPDYQPIEGAQQRFGDFWRIG
jgi:hypothetical protein